jgi:PKD repeat protein
VVFDATGTYQVTLQVTNSFGSDTETKPVLIREKTGCDVRISILTDRFGKETTWKVKDAGGTTLYSGGPYANSTQYTLDVNLQPGNYTFTIYDSWGDGICCAYGQGSYSLTDLCTGLTIAEGGDFTFSETTAFSIREETGTECGPCSGAAVVIENCTFLAGKTYTCTGTVSITAGPGVLVETGAQVTLTAPSVNLKPGFTAEPGALLLINP